ncbi:MAG TPA: GNAT family N-acetyltransferase [Allosphingosinicella sp.]
MVPTVETARFRLRAIRENDLDGQAAMLADPEVMRFVGGQPISREETWRKLIGAHGMWCLLGFGYWTLEDKATGTYLGQIGFADFKRDVVPSIEGLPEMGWMLAPHAHGRGVATEAVLGALGWADMALPGRQIVAIIDEGNAPSIRVAEKAGFDRREPATYKDAPILIFRRG